jgi:hypothetical protein
MAPDPRKQVNQRVEDGGLVLDPAQQKKLQASIRGKEQAPAARQQGAMAAAWSTVADALGDPFDVQRIPISKLRLMQRDPILRFGLSFIEAPVLRAPWLIEANDSKGPNAQVAAFVDQALREVWVSRAKLRLMALRWGFSPGVKRFATQPVLGTYMEGGSRKNIWSEGVDPVVWKRPVPLPPEQIDIIWKENTGEFDGIKYTPKNPVKIGSKTISEYIIDVYHSIWGTNEKESVDGSPFGYPRLGYAYQPWWSYWHRWALADRHFEKDADPPIEVRYPSEPQYYIDDLTQEQVSYQSLALAIGDQVRSGSTVAIPSESHESVIDGRPSTIRKWELNYLQGGSNFEVFEKTFDYLDVLKLRCLWVPENALVEGSGGTSSRNVGESMQDVFLEIQEQLMEEIDDDINRYDIPQLVQTNFPEFEGTVKKVTKGFKAEDIEAMRQVLQLVAQSNINDLRLDSRELAEQLGLPTLSEEEFLRKAEESAANPALQPPGSNTVGVVPVGGENGGPPGNPSTTSPTAASNGNGQLQTGFTYVQPPELIVLADSSFIDRLPASPHFADRRDRAMADEVRKAMAALYRAFYGQLISTIREVRLEAEGVEASDSVVELATPQERLRKAIEQLTFSSDVVQKAFARVQNAMKKVMNRSGRAALTELGASASSWSADNETASEWLQTHLEDVFSSVQATTKDQILDFVANRLTEGVGTSDQLARDAEAHFGSFDAWRSELAARTELRDAFNAGTLLAGQMAGVKQAQATDGVTHDEECRRRNGKVFQIEKAMSERDHPNGELAWKLLPPNTEVTVAEASEPAEDGALAWLDDQTIYFHPSLEASDRQLFVNSVVDYLRNS